MVNFDYKILDINNYLTNDEFDKLNLLISDFNINTNDIKSSLGFLQWSDKVQNLVKLSDNERYQKIVDSYELTYDDFTFLKNINDQNNIPENEYFNFLLTHRIDELKTNGIYDFLSTAYQNILFDVFGKKLNQTFKNSLFGHINVYPQGSFIKKHTDGDPLKERLFTAIFFLNNNRKNEDGSILKVYTKDGVVDIIPDIKTCVILENQKYNYYHEVNKNISNNIRYSIYSPFTINDYNEKLID